MSKYTDQEYLITNGLGGFCSGPIQGPPTRKYHAYLNASLNPPIERHVLLGDLLTKLTINEETFVLERQNLLESFSNHPHPCFDYKVKDVHIRKTIAMAYLENTTAIQYDISTQENPITIQVQVYTNIRDHHDLTEKDGFTYKTEVEGTHLHLHHKKTSLHLQGFGQFISLNTWSAPLVYAIESRRGQPDVDHHFIPGYYQISIPANTKVSLGLTASTQANVSSPQLIIQKDKERLLKVMGHGPDLEKKLLKACQQFVVYRQSTQGHSVIAGYPWFTDWGRDTMIALRGLCLATKDYALAKSIISTFIDYEDHGLIPNMFPDTNSKPLYNTIDGTLWMFIGLYDLYQSTKDSTYIKGLWPKLEKIMHSHISGTIFDIKVDHDGLLQGGNPSTQLTWMDVKIDGIVVTPRHGKAVEINSLWYNALKIMAYFKADLKLSSTIDYEDYAQRCLLAFNTAFINDQGCLYDLIQDGKAIDKIRPNQVFAVALPFSILPYENEKNIVDQVSQHLLTKRGLRSLSQDDPDYIGSYDGDVYKRDFAYHQGTVWGWLMGPYLEAHYKVYNDKAYVHDQLQAYLNHFDDTGIDTLSEVFYGDAPHHARGCFAQAWSVSEAMRIYRLINA